MNLRKDFDRSSNRIKYGVIAMFVVVGLVFVFRGVLVSKFTYEVREPDFSRSSTNIGYISHFCNKYKIDGNCIEFIDEFGTKQRICGTYKIVNN